MSSNPIRGFATHRPLPRDSWQIGSAQRAELLLLPPCSEGANKLLMSSSITRAGFGSMRCLCQQNRATATQLWAGTGGRTSSNVLLSPSLPTASHRQHFTKGHRRMVAGIPKQGPVPWCSHRGPALSSSVQHTRQCRGVTHSLRPTAPHSRAQGPERRCCSGAGQALPTRGNGDLSKNPPWSPAAGPPAVSSSCCGRKNTSF